jgi:hypothetical protein
LKHFINLETIKVDLSQKLKKLPKMNKSTQGCITSAWVYKEWSSVCFACMHSDTNISSCLRLPRKQNAHRSRRKGCTMCSIPNQCGTGGGLSLTIMIKSGKKVREKHQTTCQTPNRLVSGCIPAVCDLWAAAKQTLM